MSKGKRAHLRSQKLQRQLSESQKQADDEELKMMLYQWAVDMRENLIEITITAAVEHLVAANEISPSIYFDDGIKFLRNHLEKNFRHLTVMKPEDLKLMKEHVRNPARKSFVDTLLLIKFNP